MSNSSQRCSVEARSGLCAGQRSSYTPDSVISFSADFALCTRVSSCSSIKVSSPKCCNKFGSTQFPRTSLCGVVLRFIFTGITRIAKPVNKRGTYTYYWPCSVYSPASLCNIADRSQDLVVQSGISQ